VGLASGLVSALLGRSSAAVQRLIGKAVVVSTPTVPGKMDDATGKMDDLIVDGRAPCVLKSPVRKNISRASKTKSFVRRNKMSIFDTLFPASR